MCTCYIYMWIGPLTDVTNDGTSFQKEGECVTGSCFLLFLFPLCVSRKVYFLSGSLGSFDCFALSA